MEIRQPIHSGVGTRACTFIRGMVGEHQVFKDMDPVAMTTLQQEKLP